MTTATDTLTLDPLSETMQTLDALIDRHVTLSLDIARLRQELADVAAELKLRKAQALLAVEGKNETERKASLTLTLHGDADYRRLVEQERTLRQKLTELEARLWATRQRVAVCLSLLKLAAEADAGEGAAAGAGAMEMEAVP